MRPAVRTQVNPETKKFAKLTTLHTGAGSLTRQEFKDATDVNVLLRKHGVDPFTHRPLRFGDVDYNMDLQQAFDAVARARTAYDGMDADIRARYKSPEDVMAATMSGELQKFLAEREEARVKKEREDKRESAKSARAEARGIEKELDDAEEFEAFKSAGGRAPKGGSRR